MKAFLVAATTAGLLGSAALAPAFAAGPRPSSENNWPGMAQPVAGTFAPGPGAVAPTAAAGAHWQWQMTYAHGGKPRGEWVLVP